MKFTLDIWIKNINTHRLSPFEYPQSALQGKAQKLPLV